MARPFQFFDREAVEAPLLKTLEITCSTSRKGKLVFGDHEGVPCPREQRPELFARQLSSATIFCITDGAKKSTVMIRTDYGKW